MKNVVEEIALDMMSNGKFDEEDYISDESIISKIRSITDLEQTDRDGRTLLINAACYEREPVVKYLLGRSVAVNTADKLGFTALHAAVEAGNAEITEMLLKNGADPNMKNEFGNSPIMAANSDIDLNVIRLLLAHGADAGQTNHYGVSALDMFSGCPDILAVLVAEKN